MRYVEAGKEWEQLDAKPNTDVVFYNLDGRGIVEVKHSNMDTGVEIARHVVEPEGELEVELCPLGTALFFRVSPESDVALVRLAASR